MKKKTIWGILFIAAYGLRLFARIIDPLISRDGALYITLSEIWLEKNDISILMETVPNYWIPPLYIYVLKELLAFGANPKYAGIAFNIIVGSILPIIVFEMGTEIKNAKYGLICSILFAVDANLIKLSIEPQREILFLFFVGVAFWVLGKRNINDFLKYCITGFIIGISVYTRIETVAFFLILLVYLIIQNPRKNIVNCLILVSSTIISSVFIFFLIDYKMSILINTLNRYNILIFS